MQRIKIQHMKKLVTLCSILLCSIVFADDVSLTLKDGSIWNGEVGQSVTVEYTDKGKTTELKGELTRATAIYIIVDG